MNPSAQNIPASTDTGPIKEEVEIRQETADIVLPSGFSGTIRRMKLKEFNLITSRSGVRKGNTLEKLFERVWVETEDLGVYDEPFLKFPTDSKNNPIIDWQRVFQGDRNALLLELRKLIRGNDFDFDVNCRQCRRIIKWRADLSQLQVFPLSDEAKEQLKDTGKNEFDFTFPYAKDTVTFKLLQGYDQNAIAKLHGEHPDDLFTAQMGQRLVHIPGATNPKERKAYIEEIDSQDMDDIRDEWDSIDCEVDLTISIECQGCGKIQQVVLPLDEDFFSRKRSRRKKRRER